MKANLFKGLAHPLRVRILEILTGAPPAADGPGWVPVSALLDDSGLEASHLRSLFPTPADFAGLRSTWRSDLLARLTVGIVALPVALAFGISSRAGAPAAPRVISISW